MRLPTLAGVDVHDGGDREAPLVEPPVVGKGVAEVAGADDHNWPIVGESELAAHLEEQVLDVVAHTPRAVRAEVGEVLAHLGGVDTGQLGKALR